MVQPAVLDARCDQGQRQLSGHYVVPEVGRTFAGDCHILGLPGTRIELNGPLTFENDVKLSGNLTITGNGERWEQACFGTYGVLTVTNHSTISVTNCINRRAITIPGRGHEVQKGFKFTSGGCISAEGVLVEGGTLSVRRCHGNVGGGINVGVAGFLQRGGKVHIEDCYAEEQGGGMTIVGNYGEAGVGLHMDGGTLLFRNCTADSDYGGGLLVLDGPMIQKGGNIRFKDCTAYYGGGAYVGLNVIQEYGVMEFQRCKSLRWGDGGGMYVREGLKQVDGEIRFLNCTAGRAGGGIYISKGSLQQLGGDFHVLEGFSHNRGGGIAISTGHLIQTGGYLEVYQCWTEQGGGGIAITEGGLRQSDGTILVQGCGTAGRNGGCIYLLSGDVEQTHGTLALRSCEAEVAGGLMTIGIGNLNQLGGKMVFERGRTPGAGDGGCVNLARGGLVQTGGSILFSECHAGSWGSAGALSVSGNLRQTDGQLLFYDCTSPMSGGALCVMGDVTQEGGLMEFQKCYSEETGGGMYVLGDLTQLGGVIEFLQCATGSNISLYAGRGYAERPVVGGGALHIVRGNLIQKAGSISVDSCTTEGSGGGIFILNGDFQQTGGSTNLQNCTAEVLAGGIGLQNGSLVQEDGMLWISDCHAGQAGGACSIQEGDVKQTGTGEIFFDACSSEGVGGGLCAFSRGSVKLMGKSVFQHCVAGMSGAALYSIAPTTVASSTIIDTTIRSQVSFFVRSSLVMQNVSISGTLQQPFQALAREINITQPPNCSLLADGCQFTATSLQVPPPLCSQGTGVVNLTTDGQSMIGCEKCPQGFMQLMDAKSEACRPCPASAQICEPARVKMRPGYMVTIRSSINDLSPPRRCAAPKACPGRSLPDERSSMCAEGYAGGGCLHCDGTTHAAADGQSLSCTKCGDGRDSLPMEMAYLTAKMLGIFTIALLGGFTQKDEETTTSSILLNQLMAFSAAGLVAVGAAADTTAARADETLGGALQTARQVLAVSQADLGLTSFECILSSAGRASSMGVAQVLSTALPTLVMLSAGMRYPYLALVAGSNCFLPGFAASLGKFVVVVPDVEVEETGEKSQLVMPDLPQGFTVTTGVMFFGGLILLCFAAVGVGWSYLAVMTKESPTPAHVSYLRSAFNPDHSAAEVERMVRKMLFRLLPVLLPVGAYPASHMACASILLVLVLVIFVHIKPYREMWLNHVEIALVTIALLMVFMAKWLLSRDVEGTEGSAVDVFLLGTLASLGFTVAIGLTASLLWFLFGERQGRELLEDL